MVVGQLPVSDGGGITDERQRKPGYVCRCSEPHVGMYSYVAVGSTGEDYDVIADTSHGHIHFAGEVSPYVFPCAIRYNYS